MRRCLLQITRKRPLIQRTSSTLAYRCTWYSTSSERSPTSDEMKREVHDLIKLPVGSIPLYHAEQILRTCSQQPYDWSVDYSFQLLDRLCQEPLPSNDETPFPFLNSVIYHWRKQFMAFTTNSSSNNHASNTINCLLPSQVLEKIHEWNSTHSTTRTVLQANTKTYATILEAAASYTQDHDQGVLFCDSLLRWLLEESKTNIAVRPTTVSVAAVMNAWVRSDRSEAPQKVQEWFDTLITLHEEGWPDLQPNVFVYNILLKSHARAGNVEQSEQLLQDMLTQENNMVQPDTISFTTLLNAYAQQGTHASMARAETLLEQMHELFQAGYEDIQPNTVSYTTVMDGYARLGQGIQAETLLLRLEERYRETQETNLKPDEMA